jgi:GTP-binding protein YchF
MLKVGIIGQPRAGKTTVYNAVAAAHADPDAYQGRDELRRTMVKVPDPRLDQLHELLGPPKKVYAEVEYFDFPPLTGDAGEVALLPPALRELNALIMVLRAFGESPDPAAEARLVDEELIIADLVIVEKRSARLKKEIESGQDEGRTEYEALLKCRALLDEGRSLRGLELSEAEERLLRGYGLLSRMPLLAVINAPDDGSDLSEDEWAARLGLGQRSLVRVLRGKLEAELALLDPEDRAVFMADYNLETSALDRMITACYSLLGLITFFTGTPEKEVRAWTVRQGARAPEAAGVIHSDFEQGFIRAEVTSVADLVATGSPAAARKAGKSRLEGKEYIVNDGDFIHFRFNV